VPTPQQTEVHRSGKTEYLKTSLHHMRGCRLQTKHVVYLIQCKRFGRPYWPIRFKKHLQKIKQGRETNSLNEHFRRGTCTGVNNMTVQVLHVLGGTVLSPEQTETEPKKMELLWTDRISTGAQPPKI